MARNPRNRSAVRTLIALFVLVAAVFSGLGAASIWGNPQAEWSPQLGLDLAGGRQIIIEPVVAEGGEITTEQVDQAIDIIRNRVDGQGTSEAEVSRLGGNSIVVSIPGNPTAAQMDALGRSSQMRFRTVLQSGINTQFQQAPPTGDIEIPEDDSANETGDGTQISPPEDTGTDDAPPGDDAEVTEGAFPQGLTRGADATGAPTQEPGDEAQTTEQPGEDAETTQEPGPAPEPGQYDASDLAWITPELQAEYDSVDCFDPEVARAADTAPAGLPVVACSVGGLTKYILGPSELDGSNIEDATGGFQMGPAGPTGLVEVSLALTDEGRDAFRTITERLFTYPNGSDQNRFAMVLDGQVLSAPGVNEPIRDGRASITGDFTMESAQELANQLKFGALPISFEIQTSEQVSPTLGGEQLRLGLLAGAIGLMVVFVFMLVQYRALGLVTVATLLIAGVLTYGVVTLLGWSSNLRLTMAGVTGLIMAIGIIADSFIVYFERIKDEVRAGRPLRYAVDTGWQRARRTILISDAVNLVAASVLYLLSESSVRAFAFALGLITIIDLIVVFMFTHPVVSIMANGKFFGEGHKWSGMDPERLGAKRSTYLGRGQFRAPEPIRKRAHSREELEGGVV